MTRLLDTFLDLQPELLLFARRYLDSQDAEDAVQTTAMRIAKVVARNDIAVPRQFIWSVNRHAVFDLLRRRWRQKRELVSRVALETLPDTSDNAGKSELAADVWQALDAIPPADRLAILLRFHYGLTLKETANFLGISVTSVHRRIAKAIDKLRNALTPREE